MAERVWLWGIEIYRRWTAIVLLIGVYGFVLSLTGFKDAWKLAFSTSSSGDTVQNILDISLATPFTGLLSGIVITSLIQSSSATIAIVVATVASGVIDIEDSIFILLGANIGTTITNTIVGLARIHKPEEFERLVPSILVDDVFKIMNVAFFFAIEVLTGLLSRLSQAIVGFLDEKTFLGGFLEAFPDFIDVLTEPVTGVVIGTITSLPVSAGVAAAITGIVFFAMLIGSLSLMGEALETYLHDRSRALLSKVFGGKWASFGIGFVICWLLQSSSVAVSLILPLVSQSAITLPSVYYYSIGAALATTCDAGQLLSYLKFGPIGLTAGMVHILLNVFGAILFLTVPGLKDLPPMIAERLSNLMCRYRHAPLLLIGYVGTLFFGFPLLMIYLISVIR